MRHKSLIFFIFLGIMGGPGPLYANAPETFGAGSVSPAMGGVYVPRLSNSFGAYYNPASLIFGEGGSVGFGFLNAESEFDPISSVVIENRTLGNRDATGDVSTRYTPTRGFNFGVSFPLRRNFRRLALGVTGFVPAERIMRITTSEPFIPAYPMYENRTQRMVFYTGAGFELLPGFALGAGANIYFNAAAKSSFRLNQSRTNPTATFAMEVVPAVSPMFGAYYAKGIFSSGVNYRAASSYKLDFPIEAESPSLLGGATLPFGFDASSVFFFDPASVSVDGAVLLLEKRWTIAHSLLWQQWSRFVLPHAKMITTQGMDFGSYEPESRFRDVVVPRLGTQYQLSSRIAVRGGYAFHPTPVSREVGIHNLLDADKHVMTGGFGFKIPPFFGLVDSPLLLDLHCQYHKLLSRRVTKVGQNAVGAPGYNVGGRIWNYGLTLTAQF